MDLQRPEEIVAVAAASDAMKAVADGTVGDGVVSVAADIDDAVVAADDAAVVPSRVLPLQQSSSMTRYCGDAVAAADDDGEDIAEVDSPDYYCP